ncbi:MAG: putative metal-dependent hydrolase [Vicinamibacterales bacterium]
MTDDLRYPIGRFAPPDRVDADVRLRFIDVLADAPRRYREAVRGLDASQLDTPYRPDGWTVRQVVHHVVDSHLHSYIRCKAAVTETEPVVSDYQEAKWAELADGRTGPVDVSLALLEALHDRWVRFLRSLAADDFSRTFRHPAYGVRTLDLTLALYAWHCDHHVAHITNLRSRMGWS